MRSRRSLDGVATLPLMSSGTRGVRRPTPSSRSFAVSLGVPGLRLEPQVPVRVAGRTIHPDLVDVDLRIVVEADSHEFHTKRDQITRDCWRYDELALDDWLVLRVSWVQAMHRQDWVRSVLARGRPSAGRASDDHCPREGLPSGGAAHEPEPGQREFVTNGRWPIVTDRAVCRWAQSCSNASSPPTQVCRTCVSRILIGSVLSSSQMSRSTQTTSAS